jgi:hypothetical protein
MFMWMLHDNLEAWRDKMKHRNVYVNVVDVVNVTLRKMKYQNVCVNATW